VVATDAGKVLIQTDDGNKDPLTNKTVEAPDAQPVTLNNLLRSKVSGALSGLQLASPDIATRRAAIDELLKNADPSIKPLVDKARAKETDPTLKKRLDTLWATTALHDTDPNKRLEAVQLVAARHDLDMNELLRPIVVKNADGTFNEPDERVRAAAQAGSKS
jgi:urea transport system permease protein